MYNRIKDKVVKMLADRVVVVQNKEYETSNDNLSVYNTETQVQVEFCEEEIRIKTTSDMKTIKLTKQRKKDLCILLLRIKTMIEDVEYVDKYVDSF